MQSKSPLAKLKIPWDPFLNGSFVDILLNDLWLLLKTILRHLNRFESYNVPALKGCWNVCAGKKKKESHRSLPRKSINQKGEKKP